MSTGYVTLLDLAKQKGTDEQIGIVEQVLNAAPELLKLPAKFITGTDYDIRLRTGLPTTGFRAANSGIAASKSDWQLKKIECFILSSLIKIDKAVAMKWGVKGLGQYFREEGTAMMMSQLITYGRQVFDGTSADALGFPGAKDLVDSTMVVDASMTGNSTTSIYAFWTGLGGVSAVLGNEAIPTLSDYHEQVITLNGVDCPGYVADLTGWLGFQSANKYAIGRIKNIKTGMADGANTATDKLIAQLLAKFPVGMRSQITLYMNREAEYSIQANRSAVGQAPHAAGSWAERPDDSNRIPIVVTDSITSVETAS